MQLGWVSFAILSYTHQRNPVNVPPGCVGSVWMSYKGLSHSQHLYNRSYRSHIGVTHVFFFPVRDLARLLVEILCERITFWPELLAEVPGILRASRQPGRSDVPLNFCNFIGYFGFSDTCPKNCANISSRLVQSPPARRGLLELFRAVLVILRPLFLLLCVLLNCKC